MEALKSSIQTSSDQFRENSQSMREHVENFHSKLDQVQRRDSDKSVIRHRERGKLFVRDRIDLLLDSNSRFLELSALAG
ncbi:methylcrotonoyl-CoA carboxylase, partial [bacterium]|nr:methylcrotonoyl-CoA carboxylase [bacterium]